MEPDPLWDGRWIKMTLNSVGDLLLQLAEVAPLGCDPTAKRVIPGGNEQVRLLARFDLKNDLVHSLHYCSSDQRPAKPEPRPKEDI